MCVVWTRMGAIATPCVTLDQLVYQCLHNVAILSHNVPELIADVGIGVGLVMHSEADVHSTVQIGRGLGFAQSGAGDFVSHADIIGTGSDALGQMVDSAPIGTSVLRGVIDIKLYLIFRLVSITLITKHFLKQVHNLLVSF